MRGGQPQAMLSYALNKKNIDILKIPLVSENPLSTSLMYSRYKEENNAFFHEQGSYPHQLNIEGHGKIVASIGEIIGPVAFSSLCAEEKWIKSETGKKFSRAFEIAKKWVNSASPKEISLLIKDFFPDFTLNAISAAIEDYQKLKTWDSSIEISNQEYEKSLEIFEHAKLITKKHIINNVILYA